MLDKPTCSIDECARHAASRGWCTLHYERWLANGDPLTSRNPNLVVGTPAERFWAKVQFTDSCWLWQAKTNAAGYGEFWDKRDTKAHRWAYEFCVGPIPADLHLDHLCRVRNCVKPDHLEPVTPKENIRRGQTGKHRRGLRMAACKRGHIMDAANSYIDPNGYPRCRACAQAAERARVRDRRKV